MWRWLNGQFTYQEPNGFCPVCNKVLKVYTHGPSKPTRPRLCMECNGNIKSHNYVVSRTYIRRKKRAKLTQSSRR